MPRTTVLLADDHAGIIESLARLLTEHHFDVVGTVGDGHQLVDAALRLRPDVIVTDLSMPGPTGLAVLARLKAEQVESKVIVLTMHHDADVASAAIGAGASGFLLKNAAGEELVAAIHEVLRGHVYLTPLMRDVRPRILDPWRATEPRLSVRQRDVLRLIVKGQPMKEIAASLALSEPTVEAHRNEMMEVLGLHSTAELVRFALDRRLALD
jgi:DNA-binding NarL/FixJ family response regulator